MKGLEQRFIWVVTNENFEKALKTSRIEKSSRVIPSPFFFGTVTFSSEQDLDNAFYVLLAPYFEHWSRRQAFILACYSSRLMAAHEYVKRYLRPFEKKFVQMNIEGTTNVSES